MAAIGILPEDASAIIRSFCPLRERSPVSRADQVACNLALALFDAPQLKEYPVDTFLGRFVCQEFSRENSEDHGKWAKEVIRGAVDCIQRSRALLEMEEDDRLTDLSYDELNAMGEQITEQFNRVLSSVFGPIFEKYPEISDDVGILSDSGARIQTWVKSRTANEPREPKNYHMGKRQICFTLANRRDFHAYYLGRVLKELIDEDEGLIAEWLLDSAPEIHPVLLVRSAQLAQKLSKQNLVKRIVARPEKMDPICLGKILMQAVEMGQSSLAESMLKCGQVIRVRELAATWCAAKRRNNERILQCMETFSEESFLRIMKHAMFLAIESDDQQIAQEILEDRRWTYYNIKLLNDAKGRTYSFKRKEIRRMIEQCVSNLGSNEGRA